MGYQFGGVVSKSNGIASVRRQLKPWDIYDVTFVGAKLDTLKGRNDPTAEYKTLLVEFENEDGYFAERIFFPKDGDEVRPTRQNKEGHTVEMPSSVERTEAFIAQVAAVLNPEGFKKLQANASKFKSFEQVATFFCKMLESAKGTKTQLKLIGKANKDGQINAALPYFIGINKSGEAFISDNFIGQKLFFSNYEEEQRKKYLNAAPTKVEEEIEEVETPSNGEDLSDLLQI